MSRQVSEGNADNGLQHVAAVTLEPEPPSSRSEVYHLVSFSLQMIHIIFIFLFFLFLFSIPHGFTPALRCGSE
jgi:hypothetical protein